ncbi:molecular chaperone DnaJ [Leptospira gomenensis]|uniref:Molecular chaperone DnaJ n=1 Tax=Leptospira gomenensis TaxID=2484974 RepID=A0A5F1Z267_9LEPT|nr:J domain-containing protein [Leptospira gomenensis]TGK32417.1 molecular chaperone DnaJ [Leptospira gomenensis]TGK34686.1 molecular chaperone DnaJ [Leptospira gomenensis]TGK51017.1 molecular chaperone DnaJ [Leptospira gomenensis]TGK68342.1 molecular chaperone DnaJ [Leptospira gomenensis]
MNEPGPKFDFPDHYKNLGLSPLSSLEAVKSRYRELAKIFHPDNRQTGSSDLFQKLAYSYQVLTHPLRRKEYDLQYLARHPEILFRMRASNPKVGSASSPKKKQIPASRILYAGQAVEFAKRGLLRAGMRNRERKRYSGIFYDIRILLTHEELNLRISAKIPLVVRVLCPDCRGSNVFCDSCGGKGTYKSFRNLNLEAEAGKLIPGKIYELDLSGLKPDGFVHFKKNRLKVKIELLEGEKK